MALVIYFYSQKKKFEIFLSHGQNILKRMSKNQTAVKMKQKK